MSNGSTSSTIELFQSTLSSRRATPNPITPSTATMDFNPRSPHGERPPFPREGCPSPPYFNPRSPHGERPVTRNNHAVEKRFQSTLSSRRATVLLINCIPLRQFQSTLSSRRATTSPSASVPIAGFQSTLSSRRATFDFLAYSRFDNHFNPRSPHGERPPASTACRFAGQFQSTLSSRRATRDAGIGELDFVISIHALLTESDFRRGQLDHHRRRFQSTLSSRRATGTGLVTRSTLSLFQSTLSSRRATPGAPAVRPGAGQFQSTLSSRRATFALPFAL